MSFTLGRARRLPWPGRNRPRLVARFVFVLGSQYSWRDTLDSVFFPMMRFNSIGRLTGWEASRLMSVVRPLGSLTTASSWTGSWSYRHMHERNRPRLQSHLVFSLGTDLAGDEVRVLISKNFEDFRPPQGAQKNGVDLFGRTSRIVNYCRLWLGCSAGRRQLIPA